MITLRRPDQRMRRPWSKEQRGVALLVVLAWLVMMLAIVGGVATTAATRRLGRSVDADAQSADSIREAASGVIRSFLELDSRQIVLSTGSIVPRVEVLHDRLILDDVTVTLRITAWDQCAMTPATYLRAGSPFRATVPPAVLRAIEAMDRPGLRGLGLDTFAAAIDATWPVRAFPPPDSSRAARVLTGDGSPHHSTEPVIDQTTEPASAIGAFVATHNDRPWRVNLNTATATLVEAVFREAGRGGAQQILESRASGRGVRLNETAVRVGTDGSDAVILTDTSDAWSFRIDVSLDQFSASWWEVYRFEAPLHGSASRWHCVQRIRITTP